MTIIINNIMSNIASLHCRSLSNSIRQTTVFELLIYQVLLMIIIIE